MSVSIEVQDIGAVEEFSYSMRAPGLHVVKGKQGAGKTTILRTAELITSRNEGYRLSKRDGSKIGEASIGGAVLRINKQTRIEGELTIEGTGKLSITDLHTPKFEKASTRDAHRIRALVQLSGVMAEATLFHHLIGDREAFDAIVPFDALKTNDLVEMASRVKRAIEREAQRIEEREKTALADARAQASIAESVDLSKPYDESLLQSKLEDAIRGASTERERYEGLVRAKEEAKNHSENVAVARRKLESLGGSGVTVTEAELRFESAKTELSKNRSIVERLEAQLAEARANVRTAQEVYDNASANVVKAKSDEKLYNELHAIIDSKSVTGPTDEEIERQAIAVSDASLVVESAKRALSEGVKIRSGIMARAKSEQFQAAAKRLGNDAKRLRASAADTANVLTEAIQRLNDCPLKIAINDDGDPRLVISTDRSERENFDELSDGEKWIHVIRIASASNRLIVLPQSAFGELSPSSKKLIHELAVEHDCYILTALADDCELRGESFEDICTEAAE